jgi:hypothetical protein
VLHARVIRVAIVKLIRVSDRAEQRASEPLPRPASAKGEGAAERPASFIGREYHSVR